MLNRAPGQRQVGIGQLRDTCNGVDTVDIRENAIQCKIGRDGRLETTQVYSEQRDLMRKDGWRRRPGREQLEIDRVGVICRALVCPVALCRIERLGERLPMGIMHSA